MQQLQAQVTAALAPLLQAQTALAPLLSLQAALTQQLATAEASSQRFAAALEEMAALRLELRARSSKKRSASAPNSDSEGHTPPVDAVAASRSTGKGRNSPTNA